MSMTMLTILQLAEIFSVYIVMTILMPAAIFHKKVSGQRLTVRFLTYSTIGNFYFINLVYILQLLHISNRFTLWFFTLIPVGIAAIFMNHIPVRTILNDRYNYLYRLITGTMGIRTFFRGILQWIGSNSKKLVFILLKQLGSHLIEWILFFGLIGYLLWSYGTNSLYSFGYGSSDIPLHNKWINAMGENQIFIDGVYPFGLHCIIYYIHIMFSIDTYVLLRLFWLVQTFFIHLVLFAFVKALCKTRFAAYIGVGMYIIFAIFQQDCTNRFFSSLPQEFGMIFLLPSIYFALAFFKERKKEIDNEWIVSKQKKKDIKNEYKRYLRSLNLWNKVKARLRKVSLSTWYLVGYEMSFSLTLTTHFYNTMIAGLFCVAIAITYSRRFFNHRYFGRVIAAFFLSILIALLPMVFAYATGAGLQGSLHWGLNVIKGEEEDSSTEESSNPIADQTEQQNTDPIGQISENEDSSIPSSEDNVITFDDWVLQKASKISDHAVYYIKWTYACVDYMINLFVVINSDDNFLMQSLVLIGWLFAFAFISVIQRRFDYALTLISSSVYLGFLFLLLGCSLLGIPQIMDSNRCRIFLTYSMPIIWSFSVDAPVYALFGAMKRKWVMYLASLIVCGFLGTYLFLYLPVRTPKIISAFETNQAVTCLANIIRDNKDFTWTIVSAGDETNMVIGHGYHYESIEFLNNMEYIGAHGYITIPTKYVYIFIEKVPIDYQAPYANSGQSISEAGAKMGLPEKQTDPGKNDISIYQGENRWIVMSRMYYWAIAYQRMYSNEMKIYYEDDGFICYQVEQNDYRLNNFAIDYGYNMPEATVQ